ncbi:hypothetical protein [Flavobacterium ginsenosidimutans]|uniref:hypothetical protein n=1 Tax=Flavobacterium ginsenosidimutans TaxID=687844 RepID=UPI003D999434
MLEINNIDKYEFEPGIDSYILFTVAKNGATADIKIEFQNVVVAEKAEKSIQNQFKQLGFKREEVKLTAMQAAASPAKTTLGIAIIGALLTGYVYSQQGQELTNTRTKAFVKLFYALSQSVGYMPFLIGTVVLVVICLFWVVKRMANPHFKVVVVKY